MRTSAVTSAEQQDSFVALVFVLKIFYRVQNLFGPKLIQQYAKIDNFFFFFAFFSPL